jgi:hypothetical protein
MSTQSFTQAQKLTILKSATTVGIKAAAKIAGIHYTTVYGRQPLGRAHLVAEADLPHESLASVSDSGRCHRCLFQRSKPGSGLDYCIIICIPPERLLNLN